MLGPIGPVGLGRTGWARLGLVGPGWAPLGRLGSLGRVGLVGGLDRLGLVGPVELVGPDGPLGRDRGPLGFFETGPVLLRRFCLCAV